MPPDSEPPIAAAQAKERGHLRENIDPGDVWTCQLLFPVSKTPTDRESFSEQDLMSLLVPDKKRIRYYFDPQKYPPSLFTQPDKGGWPQLRNDIQAAARQCGYQLCCNGGKEKYRAFRCPRAEVYKRKHPVVEGEYRQPILPGGKLNHRPDGRSKPRITKTMKVLQQDSHRTCTMRFCIYVDDIGFYFSYCGKKDTSCREHCFHARLDEGKLLPRSMRIVAQPPAPPIPPATANHAVNVNKYRKTPALQFQQGPSFSHGFDDDGASDTMEAGIASLATWNESGSGRVEHTYGSMLSAFHEFSLHAEGNTKAISDMWEYIQFATLRLKAESATKRQARPIGTMESSERERKRAFYGTR
jgi:hypothetical protein